MARHSPRWRTPRTARTSSYTTDGASCWAGTRSRVASTASSSASCSPSPRPRRAIALLYASRLLFLAFLEAKGWLDGDREFLRHAFDDRCGAGGEGDERSGVAGRGGRGGGGGGAARPLRPPLFR